MLSRARTREVVRRRRTTVAASTALAVIAGILVAYAVNADGYPVHKAELNDGGVWVTNQAMGAIGRQNVPVAQIDARVFDGDPFVARTSLDVLQDGSAIVSVDRSTGSLMPVDAALGKGLDQQRVTAGGRLALLGGDSLASVDPTTGKVWATTVDPSIGAMSLDGLTADTRPVARAGGGAIGVAGRDGTVYVASTDEGRLVSLRRADDGPGFTAPTTEKLGADIPGALAQMSAVGGQPLMLDDKGNLATPDDALTNVGDGALLQQAGPDSSDVLVATPESLLAVGLDAGTKRVLQKVGPQQSAAAPVVMPGGCAFAAWGSGVTGTLSSVCDDRVQTYTFKIQTGADLVFRVNRNQVVLNDQKSGMTWDVTSGSPQLISNWEAFRRKTKQKDDKDSEKTEAETSTPPQANPDHLGVRDGRTSVLHVLDNDLIGSDGILSIVDVKGVTRDDVQVSIAPDRQTLLATVDPGVSGTVHFGYTISDGGSRRSSQDDGEVTLTVRDDAGSGTPKLRKHATAPTYSVTAGGVLEFPVTNDWRDADYGDPVVVQGARGAGGLEVSTTALGLVRVGCVNSNWPHGDGLTWPHLGDSTLNSQAFTRRLGQGR
ncbi:hypothetical protein GCM10011584_33090 [Nocardioides phosphati]|uniref:PQQ-binding-like beta-propeller repeat protein n=1 Tax=Nocardioides phosphati TaxID=1867775 RepID=A0ABQ2NEN5_9ACTN|nr:Ig-like domain-containing protein [Nocardioides phosphati]GGO93727.1 hypothetical protein GCM10011584_33090 [Nocardioides phosphati]